MNCLLRQYGAISEKTLDYINPNIATKQTCYVCPDCNQKLIFKKGLIKSPHFSHKKICVKKNQTLINELKSVIKKNIIINRLCVQCNESIIYEIESPTEKSKIIQQGTSLFYIENNKVICTFETGILIHSEPWFKINEIGETLICTREISCDSCLKGEVFFNQRGAGCGKTYESVQLLNNPKFINKKTLLFLTKMHSAKEVIYNEIKQQYDSKLLYKYKLVSETLGKQYKIKFDRNGFEIIVIIGTIDSFTHYIVDKKREINNEDYYNNVIHEIKDGYITNELKYCGEMIEMNNNTLIIIDEAQDLGNHYMEAFVSISNKTKMDLYMIGDKLQSIWGDKNIYTCIDQADAKINKTTGINQVMRFHNEQFKKFVNTIIPYEKYNLPEVIKICDKPCKYIHEDIKPYTIFNVDPYYKTNLEDMYNVIHKIIHYMELEIEKYNYLPNNFMFIFPILSKNNFAVILELELQRFWESRMKDKIKESEINDGEKTKWVYLHKAEQGKTIQLNDSEHATRILSIHTSKGAGREVVFLLGVTEHSLNIFSKKTGNIVYDSLLHVAITRQKKSIYVGIENNNDDICRRFKLLN